jgi:RNA polymerase sigma-70 factor (ECF subfamily)
VEGNPADLLESASRYRNALVSHAEDLLGDRALAEDAVQEVFLTLMEKTREFRPELGAFPWVRKFVGYKTMEFRRARRREQVVDPRELRDRSAERPNEADPRIRACEECLAGLSPEFQEVLRRRYWSCESGEQIAETLNRTVNAVWLILSRARKTLRRRISARLQGLA